jgi:hypothetical protein
MPVEYTDPKKKVYVEVIDGLSGVAYEGADYFKGDKFYCTPEWAAILCNSGKVRETEEPKKEASKKDGGDKK